MKNLIRIKLHLKTAFIFTLFIITLISTSCLNLKLLDRKIDKIETMSKDDAVDFLNQHLFISLDLNYEIIDFKFNKEEIDIRCVHTGTSIKYDKYELNIKYSVDPNQQKIEYSSISKIKYYLFTDNNNKQSCVFNLYTTKGKKYALCQFWCWANDKDKCISAIYALFPNI